MKRYVAVFSILFLIALATPQFQFEDQPPPIKTPVTVVTGPEGITLDSAFRGMAETAGLVYLSREVPNTKITLKLKGMPFQTAWTLLMRTYGDGLDDLFVNRRIVIVAPPTVIERVKQRRTLSLEAVVKSPPPGPAETLAVIPIRPLEGLPDIVAGLFEDVRVQAIPEPPALVVRGEPAKVQRVRAFLETNGLALNRSLEDILAAGTKSEFTAVFYTNLSSEEAAKATVEALKKISPEASISFVPGAGAILAKADPRALAELKATLEKLGLLTTLEEQKARSSGALRVYDVGLGMKTATAVIEALVGDGGTVKYDERTGYLYVFAKPEVQKRVAEAVQSLKASVPAKKPLEVEPGNTLLYYRTTLRPSLLAKYLEQVLPEAGFIPMDENSLLLVKGAPLVQRKVAFVLNEIDKEDPSRLEARRKAEQEARAKAPEQTVYQPKHAAAEALAETLKAVLAPSIDLTQAAEGGSNPPPPPGASSLRIAADSASNQVFISGPANDVEAALQMARRLDVPPSQAAIRVWIEEVDRSAADQLGIDWSFNTGKLLVGLVSGGFGIGYDSQRSPLDALSANLSLLEQTGRSHRLLDTTLLALNSEEASVLSGGKLLLPQASAGDQQGGDAATSYDEYEYGLKLSITPHIPTPEAVILEINTQVGNMPQSGPIANSVIIPQSKAVSKIRVKPGVPVILGGVIGNETNTTERGIPVLKDIPFIGALFKTTETTRSDRLLLIIVETQVLSEPTAAIRPPAPKVRAGEVEGEPTDEAPKSEGLLLPPMPWEDRAIRYQVPVGGER